MTCKECGHEKVNHVEIQILAGNGPLTATQWQCWLQDCKCRLRKWEDE